MDPIIKTYTVKVVREAGQDPVSGQFLEHEEQSIEVDATGTRAAYSLSHLVCTLKFRGQIRRTFINGEEYFDDKY